MSTGLLSNIEDNNLWNSTEDHLSGGAWEGDGYVAPAPTSATSGPDTYKAISGGKQSLNSLNEPVSTTLKRDMHMVWKKMKHVLIPKQSDPEVTIRELRNCMSK